MTVRRILPWPHACLRTPAAQVAEINDEIRALWDDMIDTMDAMPGSGWPHRRSGCRCRSPLSMPRKRGINGSVWQTLSSSTLRRS